METRDQGLRRRHHRLTRRQRRRVGGYLLHACKEILQCRRQPGIGVGQHVVDLLDLHVMAFELTDRSLRRIHLIDEEPVVKTLDGRHGRSLSDKAGPGKHRRLGRLLDTLATEAGVEALAMLCSVVCRPSWAAFKPEIPMLMIPVLMD